ncbi:acetyl-CoA C-acyltransferase [Martelella soudanensis]|uniref:acetyl-CoA C-acyltransferase n=1 Tax=unclassified Martelella TaxID=2629616 RepID=UPI0015DD55ED|nr:MULTISPECIES: acetyl-CoA C-acyltransferase [unclassified Martelella]
METDHVGIAILSAARTPIGSFQGALSGESATALGAAAIREATRRAGIATEEVEEAYMGCVLPAGLGQAPARQAALGAGLPLSVPSTTVSKVCGSGMKAIMLAADGIKAGSTTIAVAGGMESMSNAPYLLDKARGGYRAGHGRLYDHMFLDGLEDAYDRGRAMGGFAEETATHYGFTREEQDAYALASLERARAALAEGRFVSEIVAIGAVAEDEQPARARPEKIPLLKPAFRENGTVTAANSSSISDGAAALVLASRTAAETRGLSPLALIRGAASHAQAPAWFTTAPVFAIRKLLDKVGWTKADVDLFEINEAFAVVAMAAMRELDLPHDRVNIHGGACALGHPIGCSGARIVVTLISALKRHGLKRGVAALCIGGGEATALAIEIA